MNKIEINGIALTEKAVSVLSDFQDSDNDRLCRVSLAIDGLVYHLANVDDNYSDSDRLSDIAFLTELRKDLNSFKKEVCHESE